MIRSGWNLTVSALICGGLAAGSGLAATVPAQLSDESLNCIECHRLQTKGIYEEWGASKHFRANVGCYECHRAEPGDKDAMQHEGSTIAILVTPKDCARCHENEVAQFEESHHAKAGLILGSLDNFLADIVEGDTKFFGGSALTVSGCVQCHGGGEGRHYHLIERITNAVTAVTSEKLRDKTWVVVSEVPSGSWGIGGQALGLDDVKRLIAS